MNAPRRVARISALAAAAGLALAVVAASPGRAEPPVLDGTTWALEGNAVAKARPFGKEKLPYSVSLHFEGADGFTVTDPDVGSYTGTYVAKGKSGTRLVVTIAGQGLTDLEDTTAAKIADLVKQDLGLDATVTVDIPSAKCTANVRKHGTDVLVKLKFKLHVTIPEIGITDRPGKFKAKIHGPMET